MCKGSFINDPSQFFNCMYKLPKMENMVDDLILTGYHSILVDTLNEEEEKLNKKLFNCDTPKLDGKKLLLCSASKHFKQMTDNSKYTFYHLVLESDSPNEDTKYGIWANHVLTETNFKNNLYKPCIEVY